MMLSSKILDAYKEAVDLGQRYVSLGVSIECSPNENEINPRSWFGSCEDRISIMRKNPFLACMEVENVVLHPRLPGSAKGIEGVLSITVTHVIFQEVPRQKNQLNGSGNSSKQHREILLGVSLIGRVEKTNEKGTPRVNVTTKHFRVYEFEIPREMDAYKVQVSLTALSSPACITDLYAFHYKMATDDGLSSSDCKEEDNDFSMVTSNASAASGTIGGASGTDSSEQSWDTFSLETEFCRMKIEESTNWKIDYTINKNYQIADTYPWILVLPAKANRSTMNGSAKFRSRGRLPVLTYLHENGAAICRSSQPLVGMKFAETRSTDDEDLCHMIAKISPSSRKQLFILDTRPRVNAWANRMQGKGFETEEFYPFIRFEFSNIENVHVMRSSLNKIIECLDKRPSSLSVSTYLTEVNKSGWLKHIRAILEAAVRVVTVITRDNQNVLVHCSDGWDRTSQVCSISCLLLDPFYRTFNGFIALIEKDWLAFGHKFTDRCAFIDGDVREVSPVFTQFLDVVWQLQIQFPTCFEFNEKLLIEMHTQLYQCKYGTFLGNCEKERFDLKLKERTKSLWGYLREQHRFFMNPFYVSSDNIGHLNPSLSPECFRLWNRLYSLWDLSETNMTLENVITKYNNHNSVLIDYVKMLQKKVNDARKRSTTSGVSSVAGDSTRKLFRALGISSDMYDSDTFTGEGRSPVDYTGTFVDPQQTPTDEPLFEFVRRGSIDSETDFEILNSDVGLENSDHFIDLENDEDLKISLNWVDLGSAKFCPQCRALLEVISTKVNCVVCGHLFCGENSCVGLKKMGSLFYSKRKASVCRACAMPKTSTSSAADFEVSGAVLSSVGDGPTAATQFVLQ